MSARRAALVGLLMLGPFAIDATAQARSPGSVVASADLTVMPALANFGAEADVRVWSGVSALASIRRMGSGAASCIESSPVPCSGEGLSLAAGIRLAAESGAGWWPYAEGSYGRYRYSSGTEWKRHFTVGAGIGFGVSERGVVRVGLTYGRVAANPPPLEAWRRPGDTYEHTVGGLFVGAGLRVR